jgi:hypothetical protein
MKCPKCGYTSFDHNDSCPKCRKDIASERHRLNLPAFTPNPPYLLGTLSGEAGVKKIGFEAEQMAPPPITGPDHLPGPEDSQALQAMEMAFEADQGIQSSLEVPSMQAMPRHGGVAPPKDRDLENDLEGMDLVDLSLDDLEPPFSLRVEPVVPEHDYEVDFSSDTLSLEGDDLADLEDELFFGEDDAPHDESLDQITERASAAPFLEDEIMEGEGLDGPLDLDKLASMVESINEDEAPPAVARKRSLDPSLGIEHMMEDEVPDLDVALGSRSKEQ